MTGATVTDATSVIAVDGAFPSDVPLLRSCENCRRKKRKCSGHKPTCTRCKAQGEVCVYRPTARYFKPRQSTAEAGANKQSGAAGRKRASVPGSTHHGVAKSHSHSAAARGRPRAMSVVPALKRMQTTGNSGHFAIPVTSLAPADLILNSSASRNQASPRPASEGGEELQNQHQHQQQQQQQQQQMISSLSQVDLAGFAAAAAAGGLAYMATTESGSNNASHLSSPELPLNQEFPFASAATAMMLGSPTTPIIPVSTPRTATSQQQFRYPQDVTAAAAAAAAAVAAAASNSTSPASSVFVSDYTQIIANQMSAQQTAAALIAANTPTAAMAATLGGGVEGSMSSAEMLNLAAGLASVSNPELLAAQTSSPAQQAASLLYTPPLGSVPHRSSAMSSTPSLTECTPSPYSVSYPLYVPPQQAVIPSLPSCVAVVNGNAIPGQAFLAASNQNHPVFASSLAPGGAPATGIDAVLPQTPSAFSQWFS